MGNKRAIEAFHRSRRMIAIRGEDLFLGPLDSPESHSDWMSRHSIPLECVRGYIKDHAIHLYQGKSFSVPENLGECLAVLTLHFSGYDLFLGKNVGPEGTEWPPKVYYGQIPSPTGVTRLVEPVYLPAGT